MRNLILSLLLPLAFASQCDAAVSLFTKTKHGRVTIEYRSADHVHFYIVDPGPNLREVSEEECQKYLSIGGDKPADIRPVRLHGSRIGLIDYSKDPPGVGLVEVDVRNGEGARFSYLPEGEQARQAVLNKSRAEGMWLWALFGLIGAAFFGVIGFALLLTRGVSEGSSDATGGELFRSEVPNS